MASFSELGLSAKVLTAVEASGYTTPTPIQEQAIPHALNGRDVLGIAQTGTGKTASFVLPMLTRLEKGRARARMPRTLIIEPTRELAAQVQESFQRYGSGQRLNVALLIGGMSFGDQDRLIDRGADVLIATPGRLLDHFERGKLLLTAVEVLVIDEADRMLDMGFIPDIERICKMLPPSRQTLFFSATMPPEITRLTEQFLTDPVRVEVARPASTALTVEQKLVASRSKDHEKREVLRELIQRQSDLTNAIVFCNRKRDVATLFRSLEKHGFSAGALHGDMDQRARTAMLHNFKSDNIKLLIASDVAARGLDIPAVSHVFNFDVPIHAEDYVHRIGRTGRAGRSGKAFTLVTRSDTKYVDAIEKLIGATVEWEGGPLSSMEESEETEDRGQARGRRPRSRGEGRGRSRKTEAPTEEPVAETVEAEAEAPTDDVVARAEAGELDVPVEALAEDLSVPELAASPRGRKRSTRGGDKPSRGGKDAHQPANRNEVSTREDRDGPVGFGDDVPAFMLIETGT